MKELKMIVCAKQIPDPEAPFSAVSVDTQKKIVSVDAPDVINPYDENALEAAIRLKETIGGFITVISVGASLSDTVLRKAIAAGADELILVEDPAFQDIDSNGTAYVLKKTIEKIASYDLILTGRQAGDWDSGQVGLILAELLGLPCVSMAAKIELQDSHLLVERVVPIGTELVKTPLPSLVTVSNEVGELRYVSRSKILAMLKKRIPMKKMSAKDLGLETEKVSKLELVELQPPPDMRRQCVFIEGVNLEEKAQKLAQIIKDSI